MVKMGSQNVKSEDDIQGGDRPLPGRYHAAVKDVAYFAKGADGKQFEVDESDSGAEKVVVNFEVLAGTVPGQAGKVITEYFAISEKALPRLQRLAICTGLLSPGEAEREVLFSQAVGRQLVIEVEDNHYTNAAGKEVKGVRVAYMGLWSLGNAAVADVPKDAEALQYAGAAKPQPAPQERQQPATQQQETEPAVAAGGDKWADL